ncbi:MAG: type II toxin-antitoxin system VapC family toxin [Candidatus Moraniibacteriota bacterium]|nr:MAG: type II toxin-antitoxin system VapC family toxin [Candidatus Moranbacteria bacterium]
MKSYILDSNIILRYIVQENTPANIKARQYFEQANNDQLTLVIDNIVVAEVVWVLKSFYKAPKEDIYNSLKIILTHKNIIMTNKKLILETLEYYYTHNLSYIDCYLHCLAKAKNLSLATFDKKLSKI